MTLTDDDPQVVAPKPRRTVRARYVVATVVCVAIVAWLLIGGLASNIVYLRPVGYAVAHRSQEGTKTFRMAGQVQRGTIKKLGDTGVRFVMFDGAAHAQVDLDGSPPALFKDCAPVVVDGHWSGTTFVGDQLLIRHGAEYSAKQKAADEAAEAKNKSCPAQAST
ncbi:MAG TPA: cytochrome c maturation protein CcmE [Acidimicrobiia bacterium]|jgi:cytochrome c-type biogenesis protein CcmE|nr:cytochrome c maturation protein CcmE [Acidimicrobiia bacterium]